MSKRSVLPLFLVCVILMCGCSAEQSQDFTISLYDSESRIEIDFGEPSVPATSNVSAEESGKDNSSQDVSEESVPAVEVEGTLLVKDKTYTFEGRDLVIIDVTNETNQNLSITVNGKYLDDKGNVLQEESKTFDQFSVGYQNYFLFRPEIGFADFTYTVDAEISKGPFYAKDIKCNFYGLVEFNYPDLDENENIVRVPSLLARTNYTYLGNTKVHFLMTYVIFNPAGEIVAMFDRGETLERYTPEPDGYDSAVVYKSSPDDKSWEWPEHLKGEMTALAVITSVTDIIPE